MKEFLHLIKSDMEKDTVIIQIVGSRREGKSGLALGICSIGFPKRFRYGFDMSTLWYLLDPHVDCIYLSESGNSFDSRAYMKNITKMLQLVGIFKKCLILSTTHKDNVDIFLRERLRSYNIKSISYREFMIEGIGVIDSLEVADNLFKSYRIKELEAKTKMFEESMDKIDKPKDYFQNLN